MKWLQNDTNGGLVGFGFAGVLVFLAILVTEWISGPVPDRGQLNRLKGHWVSHRFEHSGRRSFLVVRIRTQQGVVSLIQRDFGDLGAKAARANSDDEVQAWVERRGFKDPVGDLIRYRVWELEAAGQPVVTWATQAKRQRTLDGDLRWVGYVFGGLGLLFLSVLGVRLWWTSSSERSLSP